MSMHDRAAQFAPFAALNGHAETAEGNIQASQTEEQLCVETEENDPNSVHAESHYNKKV